MVILKSNFNENSMLKSVFYFLNFYLSKMVKVDQMSS